MQQERADSCLVRHKLRILQDKGFKSKVFGFKDGSGLFACRLPGVDVRGKIGFMKPKPPQYLREPLQCAASYIDCFQVCTVHTAAAAVHFFFKNGLEIHMGSKNLLSTDA